MRWKITLKDSLLEEKNWLDVKNSKTKDPHIEEAKGNTTPEETSLEV